MGKVDVIRDTLNNKTLAFHYDGFGNRVRKDVLTEDALGDGDLLSDIYVRDAQGNVLAVYNYKAKVDNSNFIAWLNQSIIDQHPLWAPNSQTGFIPFLITEAIATHHDFTDLLLADSYITGSWGDNYTSQIELADYVSVAPQIKEQVLSGMSFEDIYLKLKNDFTDELINLATQDVTFAQNVLQPLFMPNTDASMGIGTDAKLIEFLQLLKQHAFNNAKSVAQNRSLPIDYNTLDSFEYYMHDYLITNAGEIPNIIGNDLQLGDETFDFSGFLSVLMGNVSLFDSVYFADANKMAFNQDLYNYIIQHPSRDIAVNITASALQLAANPNFIAAELAIGDKLAAAYTLNTANFLGTLLNDGNKTILDATVSNVFRLPDHSEVRVDWKAYMRTIDVAVKKGDDGPLLPTYIPPLLPTLTGPDYLFKDTIALAEHHLYGSSRLGIKSYPDTFLFSHFDATQNPAVYSHAMSAERPWFKYNSDLLMDFPFTGYYYIPSYSVSRYLGWKNYELTDHLGNVNVSVLDKISGTGTGVTGQYAYLSANISSLTDYFPFGMPMPTRSVSMNKYRYGYNTQEKDDEVYGKGNLNSAEFWMYDTRLGRRWNLDPKPNPSISNYATFAGNPLIFIDILGDTTYRFNKTDGSYIGMFDIEAHGQIGSYGIMKTIGEGKNKQEIWDGQIFEFADPENDSKAIRDNVINKLIFVSDADIKSLLTSAGAFNYNDKYNAILFKEKSKGLIGSFDYSLNGIPEYYFEQGASFKPSKYPSPLIFLPIGEYTAHNQSNFGNYLWGASGYTLGFDVSTLQVAAHINSLINTKSNGYESQLDSKDDQNSIKKGVFHAQQFKYRAIMEARNKFQQKK